MVASFSKKSIVIGPFVTGYVLFKSNYTITLYFLLSSKIHINFVPFSGY